MQQYGVHIWQHYLEENRASYLRYVYLDNSHMHKLTSYMMTYMGPISLVTYFNSPLAVGESSEQKHADADGEVS